MEQINIIPNSSKAFIAFPCRKSLKTMSKYYKEYTKSSSIIQPYNIFFHH